MERENSNTDGDEEEKIPTEEEAFKMIQERDELREQLRKYEGSLYMERDTSYPSNFHKILADRERYLETNKTTFEEYDQMRKDDLPVVKGINTAIRELNNTLLKLQEKRAICLEPKIESTKQQLSDLEQKLTELMPKIVRKDEKVQQWLQNIRNVCNCESFDTSSRVGSGNSNPRFLNLFIVPDDHFGVLKQIGEDEFKQVEKVSDIRKGDKFKITLGEETDEGLPRYLHIQPHKTINSELNNYKSSLTSLFAAECFLSFRELHCGFDWADVGKDWKLYCVPGWDLSRKDNVFNLESNIQDLSPYAQDLYYGRRHWDKVREIGALGGPWTQERLATIIDILHEFVGERDTNNENKNDDKEPETKPTKKRRKA